MQPGVTRALVLFPLAFFMVLVGAHPLAIVCYALLTAQYWLEGERRKAAGVTLAAGAVAGVLLGSLSLALVHAAMAAGGILVAELVWRGWPFGRRLALVSGLAYAGVALGMLANWQQLRRDMTVFINARIDEMAAGNASNAQVIEFAKWWDVNYSYLGPGSVFGSVLLLSAFTLCVLDRWRRDPEAIAKRRPSEFQRMKVPDWVVWVVIVVALLWFADQRWPNDALRAATWNTAIGLTFVYWLNGFSILLYALSVFKATALAMFLVFSGLILFNSMLPILGVFGLFDTWYNFRTRFRRLALLRRLSYRPDGRDS